MRTVVPLILLVLAGLASPVIAADSKPLVVVPTRVPARLQGQIALILSEFNIANVVGVVGNVPPPNPRIRGAILRVLADQKLIANDTPGIGSVPTDAFRIQVMYTLQQFSVLNLPPIGAAATPPPLIGTDGIADGAITGAKIVGGAVGTVALVDGAVTTPKLADGAVTNPKLADASVTSQKVDSQQASPGMSLVADGAGGAQWSYPTPQPNSVPDTALSNNVALLNAAQTFSNANTVAPGVNNVTGLIVKQTTAAAPGSDVFSVTDSAGATKYLSVDKAGNTSVSGTLSGDGSGLNNLNASALSSGTVPSARLALGTAAAPGIVQADGTSITAAGGVISANPAGINLNGDVIGAANANTIAASAVTGPKIAANTITGGNLAANITINTSGDLTTTGSGAITSAGLLTANNGLSVSGAVTLPNNSIADSALSTNVPLLNAAQTFSNTNTFSPCAADISSVLVRQTSNATPTQDVFTVADNTGATKYLNVDNSGNTSVSGVLTGNGSGLNSLNASNLAAGTVPAARLTLGTAVAPGIVQVDGTTITAAGGVISASAGGINLGGDVSGPANANTIGAGKVTGEKIAANTIAGGNLAANIAINTSGNISTNGAGTITSAGLLKASNGFTLSAGALTLPNTSIADTALSVNVPLKNVANTFTGANTFSALLKANAGLTVAGALTLPNASIADTALSANVPFKNAANTFTGANTFSALVKANNGLTVAGALTLPNASVADTALSANVPLKNVANTFTGLLTANGGLTVAGVVTLPNTSIADTALSANVPLKNAANTFTGANTFSALVKANNGLTVAGALTLPNASVADTALSANVPLKNVANTFTGLLTANGGLTVAGAVTLPNTSIADTALSANVPLKNAANTFTGANTFSALVKANAGLTVVGALTLPNTSIADTALSANVPLKNAANTFTNTNTFPNTGLLVLNPAGTFNVNLRPAAEVANRVLSVPLLGANDTLATLGTVQTFSGAKTFSALVTASNGLTVSGGTETATFANAGLSIQNPAATFTVGLRPAAVTANRVQTLPDAAGTVQLASTAVVAVAGNTATPAGGVSVLVLNNGGVAANFTLTLNGLANGQILVVKNNSGQAITTINGKAIPVATGQSQMLYVDNAGAVNRAAAALTFP